MNFKADHILEYAPPPPIYAARWKFFSGGVAVGEVLSCVLFLILVSGGPIFPFTMLYAPLAVVAEALHGDLILYVSLSVAGPPLYGVYAMLVTLPKRRRNLSIAVIVHVLCFAVTLWQRAVFSVL